MKHSYLDRALELRIPPLALVLIVGYMNRFQIQPEERALAQRFGQEFIAYSGRVRRWL